MIDLPDNPARQADLTRMKRLATGLFADVTLLFVVALLLEPRFSGARFVRAFAEAAMVGALADWFAVTALFRYPLGLPIPHTAIIPRRKDSIGMSVGRFIEDNFLSPEVLIGRLRSAHAVERVARWISQPELSAQLARHATAGLNAALRVINDDDVQALIERSVLARLQQIQPAPLIGRFLGATLAGRRQPELLYELVKLVARLMEENKDAIRLRIRQESPWWLPRAIDRAIAERIFLTVEATLHEVSTNPDHPLHDKFNTILYEFINRLQHDPATIERGEEFKQELMGNPIVREFSASVWLDIKASVQTQAADPHSTLHLAIERGLQRFGEALLADEALAEKFERWIERLVEYASQEYRHQFGQLVAHTISRWDAGMTSNKIELQIGRDLQFIRINGTIVGGIAGLIIYSVSLLFP